MWASLTNGLGVELDPTGKTMATARVPRKGAIGEKRLGESLPGSEGEKRDYESKAKSESVN